MHLVSQPTRVSMHLTLRFHSSIVSGFQALKLTHHYTKVILIFHHHIAAPPKQFKQASSAERGQCSHHRMGRPSWKDALTSVNASSIHTRDSLRLSDAYICVSKLTIIGSDNGLSPGRRQAIIWTKAVILLIGPLGTNFSEILIWIHRFWFKKMYLKMSSRIDLPTVHDDRVIGTG